MTTQGDFIIRIRERLNELSARQWSDGELRRLINEGAADIARKTESLQDQETILGGIGDGEYPLASNCIRVHSVHYAPSGERTLPLEYADFKNLDNYGYSQRDLTSSYPYVYSVLGSGRTLKLIIFPAPSGAGNFTVTYYRIPTPLETNSTTDEESHVEIPQSWDDILLDYIEYRALRKDRDPRWQESKSLYDENLSTMYDNTRRWVDEAGMITAGGGHLPAWLTSFDY